MIQLATQKLNCRGARVAKSVKHLTFGFSSGADLRVVRLSPASDSALSAGHLRLSLSLYPFSATPCAHACVGSLIIKILKKKNPQL